MRDVREGGWIGHGERCPRPVLHGLRCPGRLLSVLRSAWLPEDGTLRCNGPDAHVVDARELAAPVST